MVEEVVGHGATDSTKRGCKHLHFGAKVYGLGLLDLRTEFVNPKALTLCLP